MRIMGWVLAGLVAACGGKDGAGGDTGSTGLGAGAPGSGTTASGSTTATGDTWDNFAADFFATYCVACHSESPKNFNKYAQVVDNADTIRCGVASTTLADCGAWPPAQQFPVGSGPFPSDEERDRIVAWIDAGMPR